MMQFLGFKIAPLALSVSMFATSFTPSEAFVAMRPAQIVQLGLMLTSFNIAAVMATTGADVMDFTAAATRLITTVTVVTTNAGAAIANTTEFGFRWPRLPPARLLAGRLLSGRFVTAAVTWNGAQTGTAATGLTTIPISRTTGQGASATLPIKRQS